MMPALPSRKSSRIAASLRGSIGGRPNILPCALARSGPDLTRLCGGAKPCEIAGLSHDAFARRTLDEARLRPQPRPDSLVPRRRQSRSQDRKLRLQTQPARAALPSAKTNLAKALAEGRIAAGA